MNNMPEAVKSELDKFNERWAPHDRPQAMVMFEKDLDELLNQVEIETIIRADRNYAEGGWHG